MKKFLMFDLMITPRIIRILYWINQVAILVSGIYMIAGGNDSFFNTGMSGLVSGIVIIVGGTLISRLLFEILMVPFKICENTGHLKVMKKT